MKTKGRIGTALLRVGTLLLLCSLGACNCQHHPPPGPLPAGYLPRQSKVETALADYMSKQPANALIHIIISLNTNVTQNDTRLFFQTITESNRVQRMQLQRAKLIQELQKLAYQSQRPILTHLRVLQTNGIVRNVRPLWVANVIGVEATIPVIKALATSNEVASLHLDLPQIVTKGTTTLEWNLTQIGIDKLPPISISQTVVVAVLDTGVDYTHPDLVRHIWVNTNEDLDHDGKKTDFDINHQDDGVKNGYYDDVLGWDFSGGTNEPQDAGSHGTHVAGIIVGDGTAGTRTGIATQAVIMALRESDALSRSNEEKCWEAIQYAVSNHAKILNFSSGWTDANGPDYSTWRVTVEHATDAGLLFVTVAGDEGSQSPLPFRVDTPGRVPTALTVGSSARYDALPTYSCRGPVTWMGGEPYPPGLNDYPYLPGLLKPDIVAPGDGITSTKPGGGYDLNLGGTSMAAPHVAGVAALLLGQNPELNPYDVRYLLEESAKDLYTTGPDTRSGWGCVDATAALSLAANMNLTPYDLKLENLRSDPTTPETGKPTLFYATVRNIGGQVVGNAEMRFYFAEVPTIIPGDLRDGQPDETKFKYIGSYFVPVTGPSGSKGNRHETMEGVVKWTIPNLRKDNWWLAVWVLPGPTSDPEKQPSNNGAFVQLPPPGAQ